MGATFKKNGVTFGAERFHAVKQTLDPARLMNDQDGACGAGDVRDSLSFCSLGFDVFNFGCIAVDTGSCTCSPKFGHPLFFFPPPSPPHLLGGRVGWGVGGFHLCMCSGTSPLFAQRGLLPPTC